MTKPFIMEEEDLFYHKEHGALNLYFIFYYCFVDASVKHFAFRRDPETADWTDETCINECIDILQYVGDCEPEQTVDEVLTAITEKYDFPESVSNALEQLKAAVGTAA